MADPGTADAERLKAIRRTRVNLSRLLQRCENQLVSESGLVPDADRARFETFLATARGYLDELREARLLLVGDEENENDVAEGHSNGDLAVDVPSEAQLSEYARKIQYLADVFEDRLGEQVQHTGARMWSQPVGTSTAAEAQLRQRVRSRVVREMREELLGDGERTQAGGGADHMEETLRIHRREQEELTEDMLSLAADLKRSSALMETIARADQETLDRTATHASSNIDRISAEVRSVTDYGSRHFKSTFAYWCLIILVCVLFTGAYLLIKVAPKA